MLNQPPLPLPPPDAITHAHRVLSDRLLHYYQLLFFQSPKLTQPGDQGRPFTVRYQVRSGQFIDLIIRAEQAPEYEFAVREPRDSQELATYDETILQRCQLILTAINAGKQKPHRLACCGLAQTVGCVCDYAYTCVLHGGNHIGTHD